MGKIKMGGSAVMEFEPDYCEFHITVSVQKDTASESLTKGRKQVEDILHLLTENINLKIEDIILQSESNTFSNYSDEKYYRYSKSFYCRYKSNNQVTDTIVKLLENTDNTTYHVDFNLENESQKEQIVMMAAVADAREKAEKLATAMGKKINGYKEIMYEFNNYSDVAVAGLPRYLSEENSDKLSKSLAAQMGNPKIEISKSVNVIWLTD